MKPQKVMMQAFGPYLAKTLVDFKPLRQCGLFLITGATGGGKTTILDAVCFALYGRATGALRSFSQMRNITAPDDLPTQVEYSFTLGKDTYRFCRSQRMYTARKTKERKIKEEHACYRKENGEWTLLCAGAERTVTQRAQEILGLDCDQFVKVVMLPQGEFRKLLLASSQEKAKLFEKLFATDKWSRATDLLLAQSANLKKEMGDLLIARNSILSRENVETIEQLTAKEQQTAALYKQAEKNAQACAEKLKNKTQRHTDALALQALHKTVSACKTAQTDAQAAYEKQTALFCAAKKAAAETTALQGLASKCLAEIATLKNALASAQKLEKQQAALRVYKTEKQTLQANIEANEKAAQTARLNCEKGEQYLLALQKEINRIPTLYTKAQTLEEIARAYSRLKELTAQNETHLQNVKQAQGAFDRETAQLTVLKETHLQTDKLLKNNLAFTLSLSLHDGSPCPVCGALEHPSPACAGSGDITALSKKQEQLELLIQKAEQDLVQSRAKLLAAQAQLNQTQQLLAAQKQQCEGYNIYYRTVQNDLKTAQDALETAQKKQTLLPKAERLLQQRKQEEQTAVQSLAACKEALIQNAAKIQSVLSAIETLRAYLPADSTPRAITEKIKQLQLQKDTADQKANTLQTALIQAQRQYDIAKTNLEHAAVSYKQAQDACQAALQKSGGLEHADIALYKKEADLAQLASQKALSETGRLQEALRGVRDSLHVLACSDKGMQTTQAAYAQTHRLSELLRGNNACKTPIKMFVLGMMLDDILLQANEYFATLSNGRYSLHRITENTGGNALKGLDIEIFDAFSGGARSMYTLSGGELFLASLSLAFGLSDVVQSYSGGIRLDSIFIDEGFGTLDRETLDTAMKALDKIKSMGRTVGIISHVTELKNRIGAKIEVLQAKAGSTVNIVTPD